MFIAGVEGFDLSQPFQGALGMVTKPESSVLMMNKESSYPNLCVCKQMVPASSMLAFGYCKIGHHTWAVWPQYIRKDLGNVNEKAQIIS